MNDRRRTVTVIEPRRAGASGHFREIFGYGPFYRFLFKEIMLRRWRNTLLGFWWMIIRPMIPAVTTVFTFTFLVKMPSYGLPYPIFYLSGFMVWNLFFAAMTFVPRSLLMARGLMKRSYFPRLLVPLAAFGSALVELAFTAALFLVILAVSGVERGELFIRADGYLLLFPLCLAMALLLALGLGTIASVFALFVRDVVFLVPYFASTVMFLTPVIYPVTFVPEKARWVLYLVNPMAKLVETGRWSLTGEGVFEPLWFWVSCVEVVGVFAFAVWFFLRVESTVADAL